MKIKDYTIETQTKLCNTTKTFLNKWHYEGCGPRTVLKEKYVFKLIHNKKLIGLAIFGQQFSKRGEDKYGKDCLELRRLCLIDKTPKNSESFFIGYCLRELRRLGIPSIISYADPRQGHQGTIYKASNFKYLGQGYKNYKYDYNGKEIHQRMLYQKTNGKYVESALMYQRLYKEGKLIRTFAEAKHIYFYDLRK